MAFLGLTACAVDGGEDGLGGVDGKGDGPTPKLRPVTRDQRLQYLARAELWRPVDIAALDLRKGKSGSKGYEASPPEALTCRFAEPSEVEPGGKSPKFYCFEADDDDDIKVKYTRDELTANRNLPINGEVFGEALGTRLFWALGFYADHGYLSSVICENCPSSDPWKVYEGQDSPRLATREFRQTFLEEKLKGKKIEECREIDPDDATKCLEVRDDQGWSWGELVANSKAPKVHVDALRLLAAFVQHADNKAANQRLVCTEIAADGTCAKSAAYAQDLGTTFGKKTLFGYDKAKLDSWKNVRVWKDPAKCQANLGIHWTGSMSDPKVTEASRKFLADLMVQLSDKQIEDLFRGSHVDAREPTSTPAQREQLIQQWVAAFKDKRSQLVNHRCPQ